MVAPNKVLLMVQIGLFDMEAVYLCSIELFEIEMFVDLTVNSYLIGISETI